MSVEKSLENIIGPVKRFNLNAVWIRDDEFYIDRERSHRICEGIVNSGIKIKWYTSGTRVDTFNMFTNEQIEMLKKSGADTLKFGAESGSNRMLDLMKKGIHWEDTVKANLRAKKHGITPQSIQKPIRDRLVEKEAEAHEATIQELLGVSQKSLDAMTPLDKRKFVEKLTKEMRSASRDLNFELAAKLRDFIEEITL